MNKLLLSIFLPASLYLTGCGGGSNSNAEPSTTPVTPEAPAASEPPASNSSPMYTQNNPVYSFGLFSSQLNNRYSYTLNNNLITEEISQTKPLKVFNISSSGDTYLVDQNKVYIKPAYSLNSQNKSTPNSYFISDDGSTLITSFYNSEHSIPTIRTSMTYKRIDVSGMEVKKYIYQNLLTSTTNPTSATRLNASTAIFPQGSIVFIPQEYTALDEYYELYIYQRVSWKSFEEVPNIDKFPLTRHFGGITIRYSDSSSSGYGLYNGKVYQTWYHAKGSKEIRNPKNNYFYNSIAADTVANELIDSCGTEQYHSSESGCM